jgi:hypothetical protein
MMMMMMAMLMMMMMIMMMTNKNCAVSVEQLLLLLLLLPAAARQTGRSSVASPSHLVHQHQQHPLIMRVIRKYIRVVRYLGTYNVVKYTLFSSTSNRVLKQNSPSFISIAFFFCSYVKNSTVRLKEKQ